MMRILSVLTCCFGLALFAGAAQQDDQDTNKGKKKGGNAQSQQAVVQPTTAPAKIKGGHYNPNMTTQPAYGLKKKGWSNTSERTNLNSSKSNKLESIHKGGTEKWKGPNLNAKQGKFQKQHFDLQTNKVVNKYKTVNFNQNYKIAGAQKWKGAKYQVFVNYQPQWHDQWWWTSHHNHLVFIYGGWYYWDNSYWYPAWGYAPDSVYYYDGPIYASSPQEDPAQVVANVQSALQEQGYYQGEIDGVLGPQTRAALAEYQSAQGIEPTGAVDEPTLETLGMV